MRIPVSWLGEYVDLPEDVSVEHLHAALVKVGFEEEGFHGFDLTGPVVVGQVLEFTPEAQTNGKTINWCQVDVGEAEPRGIVCGAHNFAVGDKVVVSLPGAVLPGPFPIAARKTYGHVSDGMIASARELGLGEEHDGILVLGSLGLDPEVGADAIDLLGLHDFAVEINVTPDRGYALSLRGVAREYSHSTGAAFRDPARWSYGNRASDFATPAPTEPAKEGSVPTGFPVTIDDTAPIRGRAGVSVFEARVVRGIDATRPTPPWMVARLALAGVRSISLPVDITNYVMFELGQPIHGYDLDTLTGGITVRRATAGEKFETLDGKVRSLDVEDLLVTDESGPIGLAGVMGGAKTEMTTGTVDVLIEAGNWEPVSIARTARRHKLPSEAAKRYERGVDPAVAAPAVARVAQLLVELAGGTVDTLGSSYNAATVPAPIELPADYAAKLMGVDYTADEIKSSLTTIGADLSASSGSYTVTPPSWRPDLTDKATLVEEIARIVGYDRIPSVLPVAPPGRGLTRSQQLRRSASRALAGGGLTEVLSYSFVTSASNELFGSATGGPVPAIKLANPLDSEFGWMRTSVLPGLIDAARRNLSRGLTDLALFEVGLVFQPVAGETYGSGPLPVGNARPSDETLLALNAGIPPQPWHVGALFLGDAVVKQPGLTAVRTGVADAIAAAHQLALAVGATITVRQGSHQAMHPGRTAELWAGDTLVGYAGELLPAIADDRDLPRVVALLEVDLDALIDSTSDEVTPTPIVSFPAATQDLSVVVSDATPAGDVLATVIEGAGSLLESARLVDDYRGTGIEPGSKSLTFALRFRASDRTLTAAEATEAKTAAVELAASRFGASLRE
ncbi:phenylalanine--tRNA ligase subunit beta [Conyzicola nivalis]|uniref:Phenylalanine--tRNA ligase beta subunit n=1 Tax=Conyzicola nivalis TaxID=1477021 RepID=A0A916WNV1_9MICO|nr:phenylalanine--tRNA ligase subunit beta [Conyzicola nivalis]GGB15585.1 phenylalanine--tRNA ligase beta subunit [Conyzicola nivalis]